MAQELRDITECPVCYETFIVHKMLPCQHTFCLKCLQSYGKDRRPGQLIACPICKKYFSVPAGGFDALPGNIWVEKVLDAQRTSTTTQKTTINCDNCLDDAIGAAASVPAIAHCFDCPQNMCNLCLTLHKRTRVLASHQVVMFDATDWTEALIIELCGIDAKQPVPNISAGIHNGANLNHIVHDVACTAIHGVHDGRGVHDGTANYDSAEVHDTAMQDDTMLHMSHVHDGTDNIDTTVEETLSARCNENNVTDTSNQLQTVHNAATEECMESDYTTRHLPGTVYQALYDFEARGDYEVSFRDGDHIIDCDIFNTDTGWMVGTVQETGLRGMVPSNYVMELASSMPEPTAPPDPETCLEPSYPAVFRHKPRAVYRAVYDYEANDENGFSFVSGCHIINSEIINDEWMYGTVEENGLRGMVPSCYVVELHAQELITVKWGE